MYWFVPVEARRFSVRRGRYPSYGLLVLDHTRTGLKAAAMVPDVTCDQTLIRRLADEYTRRQADPKRLLELVEHAGPQGVPENDQNDR